MSTVTSPNLVQSPMTLSIASAGPSPASIDAGVFHSPSPSPPSSAQKSSGKKVVQGLLIPTDRPQEELEEKWLPRLGRLKVEKEVVLQGYSMYALRSWYLSRTHWSWTIVTQTGKPSESISAYLIVPDPALSEKQGALELATATQFLISESHAHQRKTEYGTLLVTTPSAFGQDVVPIPGGDFRVARPYITVNIGLRRLGCGGRAVLGMESPIAAIRRKFYEQYRLPIPTASIPLSRTTSPTTSPAKAGEKASPPNLNGSPTLTAQDPFTIILVEFIKLIQASLVIWGMVSEDIEIDGLFCDETKKGLFAWRRTMGMEHEESMRLEKETSGGCIDPKTLSALLSSITSVRYQLAALDVDRVPKNPFGSPKRFLQSWAAYQMITGTNNKTPFLTVHSIRQIQTHYLNERTRHPDAFKVHRILAHSVSSATSSLSANLKGGAAEDTPLRKREHHLRYRDDDEAHEPESGVGLIIPEGQVGSVAPPDIITTDLDAYIKGILKSREKDWDIMGARKIAWLWSGQLDLKRKPSNRFDRAMMRLRSSSRDIPNMEDGEESDKAIAVGAAGGGNHRWGLDKVTARTGQVLKGGLGLVSRRGTMDDTSDSDPGGPGPASLRSSLMRKKQSSNIPTVVEPDVEEVEEQLISPDDSHSRSGLYVDRPFGSQSTRPSFLSVTSRAGSKRQSLLSNPSSEALMPRSDAASVAGRGDYHIEDMLDDPGGQLERPGASISMSLRDKTKSRAMLRTSSDGADVVLGEGGYEWVVTNPHGTGKVNTTIPGPPELKRRHSLQDRLAYKNMLVSEVDHLAVDVDMCFIVQELRDRERQLAQKEGDMKVFEESIFRATQDLIDGIRSRRTQLAEYEKEASIVEKELHKALDDVDDDDALQWANKKIQFYLSEDTNLNEVMWNLRALERDWEKVRRKIDERKAEVERSEESTGSWWRFGM